MAASADSPQLQQDVSSWSANVTAANLARDGSGTLNLIHTAPALGSFLYGIRFVATGVQEATLANVFRYDGSTYFLERQVALPAITFSDTTPDAEIYLNFGKRIRATDAYYFTLVRPVAAGWKAMALADGYSTIL